MRAIVAREHRTALAERRDAQAAHAASTAPTPSTASWSTKAPKRRKPSPIETALAARALDHKRDWAARHPAAARAERAFRKERAVMIDRWAKRGDGTAETHERAGRVHQGAIARLYASGGITADQLAYAVEIATVSERIGADVTVKTASLETRIDSGRRGDGTFYEALSRVQHEVAYTYWREAIEGPVQAVLDMIVGDTIGFTVVAKRYNMHNRRAKRLLIAALDAWPRFLSQGRHVVTEETLTLFHAAIS